VIHGHARYFGVVDVLNGIGTVRNEDGKLRKAFCMQPGLPSGILCECRIIEIDDTSFWIENNIFKDRSEANSTENVGFFLGGESYALGIALN
jgi:hypothetical protein